MSGDNIPGWHGPPRVNTVEVLSSSIGYAPRPEGTQDSVVGPSRTPPYSPLSHSKGYGIWGTSPDVDHGLSRTVTPLMVLYTPATPSPSLARPPLPSDTDLLGIVQTLKSD